MFDRSFSNIISHRWRITPGVRSLRAIRAFTFPSFYRDALGAHGASRWTVLHTAALI